MMERDSVQIPLEIDRANITTIVSIVEAYDDFAVVRTVDRTRGHIELMCSPAYLDEIPQLLDSLKDELHIR